MNNLIKPVALNKGDTIAIVSPSSDIKRFPRRTKRAITYLESKGYNVILMPNALKSDGYSAGTPEERAADINLAFSDDNVKAIMCSTGGLTANAVLPYIDYKLIVKYPKIFCGFSDITTLLLMITSKCNLVTFHGPTLLPSLGEYEGAISFTFDQFEKVVSQRSCGAGLLPKSLEYTVDNQYWDKEDDKNLLMIDAPVVTSFGQKKKVTGRLFGGNLQTFIMLMHEVDFFDMEGAILFLEESGLSTDWYERCFVEIERKGIFCKINGLMFGKVSGDFEESNQEKRPLTMLYEQIASKFSIPVMSNVDCGHPRPLLTFPLGVAVEMDTLGNNISIIEAAVS